MKSPPNAARLFYRLYKEGLTQSEIAQRFNVSQTRVSQCLKTLPHWNHNGRRGWTPKRCKTAVHLYHQGWTSDQIAQKLHSTQARVWQLLRRKGVKMRPCFRFPTGAKNIAWKGGKLLDKSGYILIRKPEHPHAIHGYVREHRLVMERKLGRFLKPGEVVHHKNKNKRDNRPANLVLFSSNGSHLTRELKNRCPRWTPQGRQRLRRVWSNFKKYKIWRLGLAAKRRLLHKVR